MEKKTKKERPVGLLFDPADYKISVASSTIDKPVEKKKRKRQLMVAGFSMRTKELKKHVSVMKIIIKDGYEHEFIVCGETHGISRFRMFAASACVLGYAYAVKTGVETVRLPVEMVWQLADYASTLDTGPDTVKSSVEEMVKVADQLLTDRGMYNGARVPQKSSVTFKLHGKNLKAFFLELIWTFAWSF